MPDIDADHCPVVQAYLRQARIHWKEDPTYASGLLDDVFDRFNELEEYATSQSLDAATQRVRAFFCLHRLFVLLSTRTGGPVRELPLTREGIQELIKFCSEVRDSEEVKLYVKQLGARTGDRGLSDMEESVSQSLIGITDTIMRAAEYLRPKLRNGASLGAMGKYLAEGLVRVRAPSDRFVLYGRNLIYVTADNKGGPIT